MTRSVIHSGGAAGADEAFGNFGVSFGYDVRCHTFAGHKPQGEGIRIVHSQKELSFADNILTVANQKLGRSFPPKSAFVANLLRRNYYQVVDSGFVVAVAPLLSDIVDGGTGWAVEMARIMGKTVYLWDTGTKSWRVAYRGQPFEKFIGNVPNTGTFAGIGSRNIDEKDKVVIRNLLSAVPVSEPANRLVFSFFKRHFDSRDDEDTCPQDTIKGKESR